jgi:Protein of unknown function (DUF1501)
VKAFEKIDRHPREITDVDEGRRRARQRDLAGHRLRKNRPGTLADRNPRCLTYGLGSANRDLPTYVVLTDEEEVVGGTQNWSSGFLPATFQGTAFRRDGDPILDLSPQKTVGAKQERSNLDLIRDLNRRFSDDKPDDTDLAARTDSYELAYRMQSAAPEAVDLTKETPATRQLYGLDDDNTRKFGTNCLLARRLVERGVRFTHAH